MIKEHKFDKKTFIGGWYIPEKLCDKLIQYYDDNEPNWKQGAMYSNGTFLAVDKESKDSTDLYISPNCEDDPIVTYRLQLSKMIKLYQKKYPQLENYEHYNVYEFYNIQKYKANGGFKHWHCERNSKTLSNRVLVFATYLYNIKNGGTEFCYLDKTVPSKKGLTVIFPTDFTHTHRSEVCNKEKMLLTGWLGFKNEF